MTKEDKEISNDITEATIKLQYKEGIRSATHMLTLPQIVGGVVGITAVVALGASGFIPLLPLVATASPTSQIVLNWLAGLGGNALAGWLTNWAGKGAAIVIQ